MKRRCSTMCLPFVSLVVILLSGCGSDGAEAGGGNGDRGTLPAADMKIARIGERLFRDRDFGRTGVACADCHSEADESVKDETVIRAGHSIVGAAGRSSTWNGEFTGQDLLATAAGAAKCAYLYQERGSSVRDALSEEEAAALLAFYAAISTGAEMKKLQWNAPRRPGEKGFVKDALESETNSIRERRGDPVRGMDLFQKACALCHGEHAAGNGPPPHRLRDDAERIPWMVRAGRDAMPFFSRDRLSDQDLADLIAYVSRISGR